MSQVNVGVVVSVTWEHGKLKPCDIRRYGGTDTAELKCFIMHDANVYNWWNTFFNL